MEWQTPADQTPLTTKGDLFTFSTVDARLAVGTNGQVLTADSSEATGLKFATPTSGSMTLLSTTSFSGTSTTISSIDQTYIDLVIICENWYKSSSGDYPVMQWNSQTGAEYASSSFQQNTTTTLNGQTGQTICRISPNNFDTSATGSIIQITFPSYSASTPNVPFWVCQTSPNANYGTFGFGNYGATSNKAALTSVTLRSGTLSNNNNGTIKIYGVK